MCAFGLFNFFPGVSTASGVYPQLWEFSLGSLKISSILSDFNSRLWSVQIQQRDRFVCFGAADQKSCFRNV